MACHASPARISSASSTAVRGAAAAALLMLLCCHAAHAASGALLGTWRGAESAGTKLRGRRSLLAATTSSGKLRFPPGCNCDRDQSDSPYRMMYDWSASGPVGTTTVQKHCFRVENVGGCDPSNKCCNGKQGLYKAEFDVVATCKSSLAKVTVDGKQRSFEFNDRLSVLRVSQLGKGAADAPGTEVCLFLDASPASKCPSLNALCNSTSNACKYAVFNQDLDCCPVGSTGGPAPPSPAPPARPVSASDFPNCNCKRDPAASRYFTTLGNSTAVGDGLTKICFDVNLSALCEKPGSPCCDFELYKMEFEVDPTCKGALAYTTVDGSKKAPFFQTNPWPAIKVTNIDKPASSAAGTQVCLFLRPQCNTLQKLCKFHDGSCTVALFNKPSKSKDPSCCPLSYLYQ